MAKYACCVFIQSTLLMYSITIYCDCSSMVGFHQSQIICFWVVCFLAHTSTRKSWSTDYVDRGKQSIETICLLLAYKVRWQYSSLRVLLLGTDQVPRELLHFKRKPRVCLHQPLVRVLRRVSVAFYLVPC